MQRRPRSWMWALTEMSFRPYTTMSIHHRQVAPRARSKRRRASSQTLAFSTDTIHQVRYSSTTPWTIKDAIRIGDRSFRAPPYLFWPYYTGFSVGGSVQGSNRSLLQVTSLWTIPVAIDLRRYVFYEWSRKSSYYESSGQQILASPGKCGAQHGGGAAQVIMGITLENQR